MRKILIGDRPPLNEDERRLMLRLTALISIPLALIVLGTVLVGGGIVYFELREQARTAKSAADDAKEASRQTALLAIRLDEQRTQSQRELAWRAYDNCVENENQDTAYDQLFRKVAAVVRQGPPTAARNELLDALQQTSDAREPFDERDCPRPRGPRPPRVNP